MKEKNSTTNSQHCLRNLRRSAEKAMTSRLVPAMRQPIDKLAFLSLPGHVRGFFPNRAATSMTNTYMLPMSGDLQRLTCLSVDLQPPRRFSHEIVGRNMLTLYLWGACSGRILI
jgi:hypothetical protein